MVLRSLDGTEGLHREGLERIFGASPGAAADRLEAMLDELGVSTDPCAYGLGIEEWSGIVWAAVDGERGQNFIGTRAQLLAAAGCAEPARAIND
jgi:alcohol dehydrogenase